jgi:hypothetical protein
MASILPFSPRERTAAKRPVAGVGQPAAIIIFPGVRYERRVETGPTGTGETGGRGRRRKRDSVK